MEHPGPSMIVDYFKRTLSIYCGGIDNLYRHHDYTLAILESIRPFPMARYWLHCYHLFVNGQKMSKSKGNIIYVDSLMSKGYSAEEVRFFLTYGHYRDKMNYSEKSMEEVAGKLRSFRQLVAAVTKRASRSAPRECNIAVILNKTFANNMSNDLDVKGAFDGLYHIIVECEIDDIKPDEASGIVRTLQEIDKVLQVIF